MDSCVETSRNEHFSAPRLCCAIDKPHKHSTRAFRVQSEMLMSVIRKIDKTYNVAERPALSNQVNIVHAYAGRDVLWGWFSIANAMRFSY